MDMDVIGDKIVDEGAAFFEYCRGKSVSATSYRDWYDACFGKGGEIYRQYPEVHSRRLWYRLYSDDLRVVRSELRKKFSDFPVLGMTVDELLQEAADLFKAWQHDFDQGQCEHPDECGCKYARTYRWLSEYAAME